MDSFDLSEQRIVQLEQIPLEIRRQIERGDEEEYVLDLSLNRLRSIEHIGVFEHVVQLDLSGNQLENVNGIQSLRRLQSLDLSRNCIATVDLLALLPALQVLKLAENSLTTIDSLQLLPELRVVDASYNRITKWPPLAGLSSLETLDLSDNMLGAFSSSLSATLFPFRLRRLSIARNQIDKLCGIACLGLQLSIVEFLAFDGNPNVLEVARSGGQLERLLAAFFPTLPLSNDGGLTMSGKTREDFTIPPHTMNYLKRGVMEDHEDVLAEFLVTGSLPSHGNLGGGGVFPPPAPTAERSLRRQPSFDATENDQSAVDNSLSHNNKLEIWKRIQEDRKAQLGQSDFAPSASEMKREKSVRWGEESVLNAPVEEKFRKPALTAADLDVPNQSQQTMQALDVSSLSVMKPLENSSYAPPSDSTKVSSVPNGVEYEALVKKLTDQVTTMRKYMKVWIKREKMTRDASARKIQKWFRRLRRKFELRQRVLSSRMRRKQQSSFQHCSSSIIQNANYRGVPQTRMEVLSAQTLQSIARGFVTRRRVACFRRKLKAATTIQRSWRKTLYERQAILQGDWKISGTSRGKFQSNVRWHGIIRGMIRFSHDVEVLQHICAVQDDAISYLWDNQVGGDQVGKTTAEKKVATFQRLWRGHSSRKQSTESQGNLNTKEDESSPKVYPASVVNEMKTQIDRQSIEIDQLKQQLQALQNLLASLVVTKFENIS